MLEAWRGTAPLTHIHVYMYAFTTACNLTSMARVCSMRTVHLQWKDWQPIR